MSFLRLVIGCLLCALSATAQEPIVHVIAKDETLADLAQQYLGGREQVVELQNLNDLPNPLAAKPGMLIVIPGASRTAALEYLDAAAASLEEAEGAAAGTYAKEELAAARESYGRAAEQMRLAAYEKCRLLGLLATARAVAAKTAADERAPVQEPAKVTAAQGKVTQSADGTNWIPVAVGDRVPVANVLATGADGRCELLLADGSELQLRPGSKLVIDSFRRDRRDNTRDSRLRVILGDVLGKVKKRKNKKSTFKINSSRTNVAIRGTEVRIGGEKSGRTKVSLLEGQVDVEAQSERVDVAANFGTFVERDQPPVVPLPLLPPPFVSKPATQDFTSGLAEHEFQWRAVRHKRFGNYRLELARDADFNEVVDSTVQKGTRYKTELAPGTYHWRVATLDNKGLEGRGMVGMLRVVRDLRIRFEPIAQPLRQGGKWIFGAANTVAIVTELKESSVEELEYSLNGGPYIEATNRIFFQREGEFEVRARGIGADGAAGQEIRQQIEVDRTAPELTITITGTGAKRSVRVAATDKNGVAAVRYRVGGRGAFRDYRAPFEVDAGEALDFRAEDRVGNVRSTERKAE